MILTSYYYYYLIPKYRPFAISSLDYNEEDPLRVWKRVKERWLLNFFFSLFHDELFKNIFELSSRYIPHKLFKMKNLGFNKDFLFLLDMMNPTINK